ncbi:MAG: hypothetical protein HOL85_22460 [Rhodospirillaceae bacterium]|nr:hypothetical protein [Rhodospirillaceae bacterium]
MSGNNSQNSSESGFALLSVLGVLLLLATLATVALNLGERAVSEARLTVERIQAATLAEGAIERAILGLVERAEGVAIERLSSEVKTGTHRIEIAVTDACAAWDLNQGDLDILYSLLKNEGEAAERLVLAVADARRMARGFSDIAQLHAVPGFSGELVDRLREIMTVHCGDRRLAAESVGERLLLALPGAKPSAVAAYLASRAAGTPDTALLGSAAEWLAPGPGAVWQVHATAVLGPGSRVERRAVVMPEHRLGQPYRILAWE